MTELPLVSVVIPTHNRPLFLKKTLDSIIKQTYQNIEIIVVSNGYNTENRTVVEIFNNNKIKYFEQKNTGGPASPRNHGIQNSLGKYIAFCDDDDLWEPLKLEQQVNALEKNPSYGLCFSKMMRFNEDKEWFVPHEEGPTNLKKLLYVNTVPISSVIIKREILIKVKGFCESKIVGPSEDYEFLLRCSSFTKFYFIDQYLIRYWSGNNRTTAINKISDYYIHINGVYGCYYLLLKNKSINPFKLIIPSLYHFKIFVKSSCYIFLNRLGIK
ncbi:glycosyltransferase family 2 protein [Fluviispira multicolorata]|uniref:Glycosyltransferase n=1 Tax=Fluviispira multicolorata TaxID=2654512 RepID=A0A833N4I0_9BACT|nr:glycosyltransferase family A protein [Fluviispira multicolorata]KAB8028045.1 glycosyltransferase [Fluviispira multicolorata]